MSETVLWSQTSPHLEVPHVIELISSITPAPAHLVTSAFVLAVADHRVLLTHIARPGRGWDLPGGHVDPGEIPAEAARRELYEETGLELALSDLSPIGWTRITLRERPPAYRYPYPTSYLAFYAARPALRLPPPAPQPDTECDEARWITSAEVRELCTNPDWLPLVADQLCAH